MSIAGSRVQALPKHRNCSQGEAGQCYSNDPNAVSGMAPTIQLWAMPRWCLPVAEKNISPQYESQLLHVHMLLQSTGRLQIAAYTWYLVNNTNINSGSTRLNLSTPPPMRKLLLLLQLLYVGLYSSQGLPQVESAVPPGRARSLAVKFAQQ